MHIACWSWKCALLPNVAKTNYAAWKFKNKNKNVHCVSVTSQQCSSYHTEIMDNNYALHSPAVSPSLFVLRQPWAVDTTSKIQLLTPKPWSHRRKKKEKIIHNHFLSPHVNISSVDNWPTKKKEETVWERRETARRGRGCGRGAGVYHNVISPAWPIFPRSNSFSDQPHECRRHHYTTLHK